MTNLTHTNAGQTIASYAYTLGPTGNRTQIQEASGISRVYTYDKLFRLTKEQVTDTNNIQTYTNDYVYDAVGNRTTKTQTTTATTTNSYTYNNADQLINENGIAYTYDLNGNLKTKTDTNGTTTYDYNYDQKLVKATTPTGATTYKYDADGNRVETSTTSGTTKYLIDANRSLAQVAAEYNTAGTITASYTYADDLISMTRGSQTYYYHFDGLGSTRLLTNSAGTITDTYSYDAFGNIIAKTGTTENAFLFTGQQYDANIGFYYQRARYYQPTTGRFTAYDPIEGDPYTPSSLHKYLYAANDPVNKVDPSGEQTMSLPELSEVMFTMTVLTSIAMLSPRILKKIKIPTRLNHYTRWAILPLIWISGINNPSGGGNYFTPDFYLSGEEAQDKLALSVKPNICISVIVDIIQDELGEPTIVGRNEYGNGGGTQYVTKKVIPFTPDRFPIVWPIDL